MFLEEFTIMNLLKTLITEEYKHIGYTFTSFGRFRRGANYSKQSD